MGPDSSRPSSPAGLLLDASTTCQHSASGVDRVLAHYGKKFAGRGVSNALLFSELEVQIFSPAQFTPLTYEGCSQLTNCDLKA